MATETTDLDDLLAMDKRELMDEVMRLRAALEGYETMLKHFEDAFMEAQAKLREMQNV